VTRILALLVVLMVTLPAMRAEADVLDAARDAISRLDRAERKLTVATTAQNRVIAMSEAIRAYDVALLAMRSGLRDLQNASLAARERYEEKREVVERIIGGMQAVSRAPRPLTFVHPGGPVGAARAGMTMQDLLPAMNAEAQAFRDEAERLATIAALQEVAETDLRIAIEDLRAARLELKTAIFEDRRIKGVLRDDTVRLARLAKNSRDMRKLVEGLTLLPVPPAPADAPEMELIRGKLPWPVVGRLVRRYREPDAAGITRRGLVVGARPLSIVSAPFTARVRYVGRFLDHGLVVILQPDPDYMLVLSGMAQVSVVAGEGVVAGRPIGVMGGSDTDDEEFLIDMSEAGGTFPEESLYIELRRRGIASNPLPWFRPIDEEPLNATAGNERYMSKRLMRKS